MKSEAREKVRGELATGLAGQLDLVARAEVDGRGFGAGAASTVRTGTATNASSLSSGQCDIIVYSLRPSLSARLHFKKIPEIIGSHRSGIAVQ